MFSGWYEGLLAGIKTLNQILTAGIAITAFSLLIYALTFNLRDRVARSFAVILLSVVVIFTAEAIQSAVKSVEMVELFLRLQWVGIVFLPPAYLHLSDALLVTAGRPSRGRRRLAVRAIYVVSALFLILFAFGQLVGGLVVNRQPAPHLQRTFWTEIFTLYYLIIMLWAGVNFIRAYGKMLTRSGRRRMIYLMTGATAPALGSYPYLLFGSSIAEKFPLLFWSSATTINLVVGALIIVIAYAVAFFGVSWPDRVVKSRLFKWIMRGPVTASVALAVMTLVRRAGETFGLDYNAGVPVATVASILLMEHLITLAAPIWERQLFFGRDRAELTLLQNLEERLLTQSDLRQFLEAVLAAVRDHMQSPSAFIAALDGGELSLLINAGRPFAERDNLSQALQLLEPDQTGRKEYLWNDLWLLPLRQRRAPEADLDQPAPILGILGVARAPGQTLENDQRQALWLLAERAALALEDRSLQQRVFSTLQDLQPQVELLQRMRAASRYDTRANLLAEEIVPPSDMAEWVREALNHYWGGPKLTDSPLMSLRIVQQTALEEYEGNMPNALRAVLKQAVEQVKPAGERRFTTEWMLYNILDLKFIEGRKVREVAARLAMSEADLYRKQRIAVEVVAKSILKMENQIDLETEKEAR
ncbi:MAG: histidine kinase N-terminal 7TM domain-containing protein [Anaerolineales bacterium]